MTKEFLEVLLRSELAKDETGLESEEDSFLYDDPEELEIDIDQRLQHLRELLSYDISFGAIASILERIDFEREFVQRQTELYHLRPKLIFN